MPNVLPQLEKTENIHGAKRMNECDRKKGTTGNQQYGMNIHLLKRNGVNVGDNNWELGER
jgi:hypothetical protein